MRLCQSKNRFNTCSTELKYYTKLARDSLCQHLSTATYKYWRQNSAHKKYEMHKIHYLPQKGTSQAVSLINPAKLL